MQREIDNEASEAKYRKMVSTRKLLAQRDSIAGKYELYWVECNIISEYSSPNTHQSNLPTRGELGFKGLGLQAYLGR